MPAGAPGDGDAAAPFLPLPPDFALFAALPDLAFFGFASLAEEVLSDVPFFPDAASADLAGVGLAGTLALAAEAVRFAVPVRLAVVAREEAGLAAGAGEAADIVLAASDSAVTAVSIALVATAMARSALVIVLAESVARAAAVFSLAAALVARVAADETALGVVAPAVAALVVPVLAVPVLLVEAARVAPVRVPAGRVAGLAVVVPLALALGRAGFAAAVFVGTELPPSQSVTGTLIPPTVMVYT